MGRPAAQAHRRPERAKRGASGTSLRGHLVPDEIHRKARRRKVELRALRGTKITWDDVMIEAISLLGGQRQLVLSELRNLDSDHRAATRRRPLRQRSRSMSINV